jgi:serine/threonine protein phosphatase PrpC
MGGTGIHDSSASFSGEAAGLLFFVADGMGGHAAGDAAGAFVAQCMRDAASLVTEEALTAEVKAIHAALLAFGKKRGTPNMGSTLAGIALGGNSGGFFNVGDSRVYRLRNGFLEQLSRDDSLAALIPGAPSNIITNAMGAGQEVVSVQCRFGTSLAVARDVFLSCSDGVHGFVSDDDLELMLSEAGDPLTIAQKIVERAIANNSDDNCTAVVVKIGD